MARPAQSSGRELVLATLVIKLVALGIWMGTPHKAWAAALFFGSGSVVVVHLLVPSAGGLGRVFTRFETRRPEVWLTIDDGPDPEDTPRLLDLLDRYGARATFFVIGRRAEQYPELVTEIVRRGHEIGHHTHSHPAGTFWCASRRRVAQELDLGLRAITASAPRPRLFRAPVGIKNIFLAEELRRRRLDCVSWSIRSGDCSSVDPAAIAERVLKQVRPGAIILVHEGPSVARGVRVEAIARVLDGLASRRLACVIPERSQLR